MKNWLKKWLISYLSEELSDYTTPQKSDFEKLMKVIQVGDVILVEGKQRVSKIIKYLTQSNWSHVAFYIGNGELIEADLKEGVRVVSVKEYANYHTRICRPKELTEEHMFQILDFLKSKIGGQYDIKHITDLMKIILNPKLRLKHVLQHLGSGNPTKVICSSLIADAFQLVNYPIIPIAVENGNYYQINSTLITPADFDISPYFFVIKPTLANFDYKKFFG